MERRKFLGGLLGLPFLTLLGFKTKKRCNVCNKLLEENEFIAFYIMGDKNNTLICIHDEQLFQRAWKAQLDKTLKGEIL